MIATRSYLDREQRIGVEQETRGRSEASLTSLQGGASVGTPWLPEEDMGIPLSEYIISPSISQLTTTVGPFENKMRDIFL